MNGWRLSRRSLGFYWRTQLGVVLGVMCAAMVLVGALAVGDSVRLSLREQALQRIGRFESALQAGDRFVTAALAERITAADPTTTGIPIVALPGVASRADGAARTGIVDAYGVGRRFFAMSTGRRERTIAPGHALVNARLARQLRIATGDDIVLRIEKPSLMPREATMATVDDVAFALRVTVDAVLRDDEFGRFGLRASQVPPFNVFVQREWLQEELELDGRVNLLAVDADAETADAALREHWTLADAELEIRSLPGGAVHELASSRVFLDAPIGAAVRELDAGAIGVLTYFVNAITAGDRTTPYSTISAIGPLQHDAAPATALAALGALAPPPPPVARDGEAPGIVVNRWLADDLRVRAGDSIELAYSVMNAALQFDERRRELQIHRVVELAGAAADPSLMPPFPGLAEARSCADWEPGIPVELDRLDDADQDYWEAHRGTPKAFVTLTTGRELWSNRYGNLTAIRTTSAAAERLRTELPKALDPADLGLFFRDVRGPALLAGSPATDFGGLFLGLSFFLILASLLLTALLFVFGVEQRHGEIGALLAFGFTAGQVRRQFLREALLTATAGSLVGGMLGLGYAHLVLAGLDTLWRDAIGQTTLTAHTEPLSFVIGTVAAVATALLTIFLATRRAFRRPTLELLNGTGDLAAATTAATGKPRRRDVALAVAAVLAAILLGLTAGTGSAAAAGRFFGAGALLLVGALLLCRRIVIGLGNDKTKALPSVLALAARNAGRRPGRSLATIALLASGTFLVVAVQANRLEPPPDPGVRASGTGGFRLFGRSTLPVLRDLATPVGREAYGLDDAELADTSIVPLRVRDGDDGSCLNLNRPQNPALIGVDPQQLASRGAFRFAHPASTDASPWNLLDEDLGANVVPAIGDAASVTWSLHKAVGESLAYRDEAGNDFEVRIVGTVTDSILQGNLLIADRHLRQRFQSASGFRMFLIDAPAERIDAVTASLGRALQDLGLELTPTRERLAAFQSVQNTYLAIFQLLGGLGLLLGTAGLGVVVLRNALERRAELATLSAIGFRPVAVRRLVALEHGVLLGLGLVAGVVAALFAIWPVRDDLATFPLLGFVLAIAATGAFWVSLASALATRGALLDALRGE